MKRMQWRSALALTGALVCFAQAQTIVPEAARMYNVSASGDVSTLFDEQDIAGDPKNGTGGTPSTEYTNGWEKADLYYPVESVIDLGQDYQLTDVYYYDLNGSDSLYMWCGEGGDWTLLFAETTALYNSWKGHAVNCTARYLRLQVKSPSALITEMVLYGTAAGSGAEAIPEAVSHKKPTFGEMMGINGFIDDDVDLLQVTGNLREYHNWMWDDANTDATAPAYPDNEFAWAPSAVRWTGGGWDFDAFYGSMDSLGISVSPVFQGVPVWLVGRAVGDSVKPMTPGADSTDPMSYAMHADYMYQFAARFGATSVSASKLRVDSENEAKSGLNLIHYMETWNEEDKNWRGTTGYFSPYVEAAVLSADYDGNLGEMGDGYGIKTADPTMNVVMGGLIGFNLDYIKGMKFWADEHRGGSFPADVLNFHHYCLNSGDQADNTATKGISPEEDSLQGRLEEIVDYRDRYLQDQELWYSEFGWDTDPDSKYGAPAIGSNSEYEIQGRWLVRAFLEIAAAGFDKAHIFMLRDTWDNSPGTFATSGLVHDKYDTLFPAFQKKPSWYYVNTLNKNLGQFRFDADLSDQVASPLRLYRFSHASDADSVAYALWNPNDSAADLDVSISSVASEASLLRLDSAQELGTRETLAASDGKWKVTGVNGRPVFILAKSDGSSALRTRRPSATAVSGESRYFTPLGTRVKNPGGMRFIPLYSVP